MADSRRRRPVAAVLLSLLLLSGALLLIGLAVQRFSPVARQLLPGSGRTEVTHGVVVEQVRSVARLVTSETTVRDVVVYQNRRLGSTKRSLVVVTGKVMADDELRSKDVANGIEREPMMLMLYELQRDVMVDQV